LQVAFDDEKLAAIGDPGLIVRLFFHNPVVTGCGRDGHNRKKWPYWRAEVPFNSPEAIVIQGVPGRRDSTVVACSPASLTDHFRGGRLEHDR
jgi:hypothetical protein